MMRNFIVVDQRIYYNLPSNKKNIYLKNFVIF